MVATSLTKDSIEEAIRTVALTKRIRPSEFFLDYDRLRSGYVTGEPTSHRLLLSNNPELTPISSANSKNRFPFP